MTIRVTFIRHAQSISNAGLATDHPSSVPLTDLGRRQAEITCAAITTRPDLIVTSSFDRTQKTAQPLIERFAETPRETWPVQEFTYMNPINWYGTTGEERTPSAHSFWERNDPNYNDGGGAESFRELIERIDLVKKMILSRSDQDIIIFSHGMFTRALWWRMIMPAQAINHRAMRQCVQFIRGVQIPNCSLLRLRFEDHQVWINGPDASHLAAEMITY